MAELQNSERLIINTLFDHTIFTSTPTPDMTNATVAAINALKRPRVQRKITRYLKDLVGMGPDNYQENLLFLLGPSQLAADDVHILLATLKAIINEPNLQTAETTRLVTTEKIVRQVRSEVVNLDEKIIYRRITQLFVERLNLLTPDRIDGPTPDQTEFVTEYWDVSPDFNAVAKCLVDALIAEQNTPKLSLIQQVNRTLLLERFMSPTTTPALWPILVANKQAIAKQWGELKRFVLECGSDYALLLDTQHQQSAAMPYIVALAVAHSLGAGLPEKDLNQRIHEIAAQLYPKKTISVTDVRSALLENALIQIDPHFVSPTPLVQRFAVQTKPKEGASS
ncbi:hypothetical protein FC83_GL000084 [Agrilactobacillus composti DSM 18527 = JCM 14202]|uniref:Uncharacterized protein n=1 Tax=Agrilactobacillus composti DSM 18527 = JCM 14202 TaxID=1423734 RepID=A0A0R1XST0_9LACO|nr:hypothetical protein [Agrilactobacillus composti]KRM32993.1 hypothetical protein FC83_GL000084 [Agrilactobacillus composti DSM 18527 = JCM 14202]